MHILGLETSCDETSAAVVKDGRDVLSNVIASSKEAFTDSGGVIPEKAAREQVKCILPVINQALEKTGATMEKMDAIAVTNGPGLLVSLLVGTTVARTLASVWKKPLIGVHHTLGHLSSLWLDTPEEPVFPVLALSASGGHTDLWLRTSHTKGKLLGRTLDDAAGEAFDKGAMLLSLPYPGGPSISKIAAGGNPHSFAFPTPLKDSDSMDFSFSGLKTSLKYLLRDLKYKSDSRLPDLAASYQHAICKHLADRVIKAIELYPGITEVHLAGGVSANVYLRSMVKSNIPPLKLRTPLKNEYSTDNAAMIAAAGYYLHKEIGEQAACKFETEASAPLEAVVS